MTLAVLCSASDDVRPGIGENELGRASASPQSFPVGIARNLSVVFVRLGTGKVREFASIREW